MNLKKIHQKIVLIRAIEDKLDKLFEKGLIHGTAHFCTGQEFIPVIVSQYLHDEDFVTSTHRGHGHAISKNLNVKRFLGELMGKKIGYNFGKSGSQHVLSKKHNFFANGVTGGMVPVANGIAFSNKYKKNSNIVVSYLGDGAMTEGYVLEALNLAAVLKLPILFVCENNLYAMSTHVKDSHSSEIHQKVKAFGITCELVEDNDYKKLDNVVKKFIEQTRKGEPHFIEMRTYRHKGHSKNDQNLYRDKDEEKFWFEKDVLKLIQKELVESGKLSEEEIRSLISKYEEEVNTIADEVIKMPEIKKEKLLKHVYCE